MELKAGFSKIRNIEDNIDLVKSDDDIVPFNMAIYVEKESDMECEPPAPYLIPTDEKGRENLEMAKRIRLGIYKKLYPDTWEVRHITPDDRFYKKEPVSETSAGYHYVRFKEPNKTKKYPCFEARVYNPVTRRMTVIGSFYFGLPYSGESLETAFYKACVTVDEYYGNAEKSFRTYLKYLNKSSINKSSYEDKINEEKEAAQDNQRLKYLRKYLVSDDEPKKEKSTPKTNLFMKKTEDEFAELKGFYPYIYITKKGGRFVLSAVVPEFEDHKKCTLGTFFVDSNNYKSIWKKLAKLVDAHYKRTIGNKDYYERLAPTFEMLTK